jgi:hypothetical protein
VSGPWRGLLPRSAEVGSTASAFLVAESTWLHSHVVNRHISKASYLELEYSAHPSTFVYIRIIGVYTFANNVYRRSPRWAEWLKVIRDKRRVWLLILRYGLLTPSHQDDVQGTEQ